MKIFTYKNDIPDILTNASSVAIDTETTGLLPHRDRLCVCQLCFDESDECHIVQFENYQYAQNLIKLLANESVLKIFHYARFDMMMLYKTFNTMPQNIYCTKIASKLARTYTSKHSLLELCKDLLDIEISKEETCSDWGKTNLSESQKEYAAKDVLFLHQIKEKLDVILNREGRMRLAQQCFDFLKTRVILDLLVGDTYDIFSHN